MTGDTWRQKSQTIPADGPRIIGVLLSYTFALAINEENSREQTSQL